MTNTNKNDFIPAFMCRQESKQQTNENKKLRKAGRSGMERNGKAHEQYQVGKIKHSTWTKI